MKRPPQEAGFYTHPDELKPEQIDPLIRDICLRINESGWVWTAESCQGHPEAETEPWAGNVKPMLRLVCETENLGDMLSALTRAVNVYECQRTFGYYKKIELFPCDAPAGWSTVLVYLPGGTVFMRNASLRVFESFAALLNAEKLKHFAFFHTSTG